MPDVEAVLLHPQQTSLTDVHRVGRPVRVPCFNRHPAQDTRKGVLPGLSRIPTLHGTETTGGTGPAGRPHIGIGSTPSRARASAGGLAYWGGFHVTVEGQPLRIPAGQLYHDISGSGFTITWEAANYGSGCPLCDTAVRFT